MAGLVVPLEGLTTVRVTVPLSLEPVALLVLVAGAVVVVVGRVVVPPLVAGTLVTLEGFSEEVTSVLDIVVGLTVASVRAEVFVAPLVGPAALPAPVAPLAIAS